MRASQRRRVAAFSVQKCSEIDPFKRNSWIEAGARANCNVSNGAKNQNLSDGHPRAIQNSLEVPAIQFLRNWVGGEKEQKGREVQNFHRGNEEDFEEECTATFFRSRISAIRTLSRSKVSDSNSEVRLRRGSCGALGSSALQAFVLRNVMRFLPFVSKRILVGERAPIEILHHP